MPTDHAKYHSDGSGRDLYITHNNGGLIGPAGERLHTYIHTYRNGYLSVGRQGQQSVKPSTPALVKETWTSHNSATYQWPRTRSRNKYANYDPYGPQPLTVNPHHVRTATEIPYLQGTLFQYLKPGQSAKEMSRSQPLPHLGSQTARSASPSFNRPTTLLSPRLTRTKIPISASSEEIERTLYLDMAPAYTHTARQQPASAYY